jgi:glucose-6-phosphate isomerase
MSLKNNNPTKTIAWGKLNNHFREIKNKKISKYFDENSNRNNELTIKWKDFYVDFSKNRLEKKTINLFTELLKEIDIKLIKLKTEQFYIRHLELKIIVA